MPRPVIIDTDVGIDDAIALLLALASPELEVIGITAVGGNLPLTAVARNVRAILELAERPGTPVYAGCPRPIAPHRIDAAHVHGDSGLGGLLLPEPSIPLQAEHGVTYLIEALRQASSKSITICAIAPLTNIATALVMAPNITDGIAELIIMGGGTRGNITPAAEFNIHVDPLAAAIVFDSGVPITLMPLDVTSLTPSTPARVEAMRRVGTRCAVAAATLIAPPEDGSGRPPIGLHDACVIAYLLEPALFHTAEANVVIETQSGLTMGMTVIDSRDRSGRPLNARVADAIDVDGLYQLLTERLSRLP